MTSVESAITQDISTDKGLVEAALSGDGQAYGLLVQRHYDTVFAIAYARLGQREAAEDLAQEVFLKAYLSLKDLKQRALFTHWLNQITRNLAVDWQRKGLRKSKLIRMVSVEALPVDIIDAEAEGGREILENKERDAGIQEAILKLPPELREIVLLRFMNDLSMTEIASRLGINRWVVHYRLKRALKMMRGMLEPILRETVAPFRPPTSAAVRSAAIVTAAAAMSAGAKSALAAQAGAVGGLTAASAFKSSGIAGIGLCVSVIKANLVIGGAIVGAKQAVAVTITAIIAIGALGYYVGRDNPESVSGNNTVSRVATASNPQKSLGPEIEVQTSGRIIDAATKQPIPGALVRGHIVIWAYQQNKYPFPFEKCPYLETTTDENGKYSFNFSTPLTTTGKRKGKDGLCVYVSAPGYETRPVYGKGRITNNNRTIEGFDIELRPGKLVKGTVVDTKNVPIEGAVVLVRNKWNGDWNYFGALGKAVTDANGEFEIWHSTDREKVISDNPWLYVSKDDYGSEKYYGFMDKEDMGVMILHEGMN